jgi:phospholipase/lecithinase/hemolysin
MKKMILKLLTAIFLVALTMPGVSLAMPYSNMYVLGDSLSDVGNLFIATDNNQIPPLPQLPQAPPYYQGRFSNGPSYAEYLWQHLNLPGDITPRLDGGTNYAVGGARSRYHVFDRVFNPFFDPLTDTTLFPGFALLGQRDTLLNDKSNVLDPDALYTVWIGSNDVADAFEAVLSGPGLDYANSLLFQSANDLLTVINDLVGAGAVELLIPNVPNLGLVPEVQALPPNAQALATGLTQAYNDIVDAGLSAITANITRLDTFQFLTDLVADPTLFDLPANMNVTDACFSGFIGEPGTVCPNPENYIFWDKTHPSAVTHQILGSVAAEAVPEPATLALFGIGLAGLGFARRRKSA